jgi:hypothetical protein
MILERTKSEIADFNRPYANCIIIPKTERTTELKLSIKLKTKIGFVCLHIVLQFFSKFQEDAVASIIRMEI